MIGHNLRRASTMANRRDPDARAWSAAVFLTIYLGIVVGFGALMGQLIRALG